MVFRVGEHVVHCAMAFVGFAGLHLNRQHVIVAVLDEEIELAKLLTVVVVQVKSVSA